MLEAENTTLILVHDAWHGAWEWAGVQTRLTERGWLSLALDLPQHGEKYRPDAETTNMRLEDYARAVVDFVKVQVATPAFVLVAHGVAGPICQRAAELFTQSPESSSLAGLVFVSAFVLRDGEAIADNLPLEMAEFFRQMAESRPDNSVDMRQLADFWRYNLISDDPRRADAVLAHLTPEPLAPLLEKISLKTFFDQQPTCAYISFNEDNLLPLGQFYPAMSNKLGKYRHQPVNASHEGPLTKPREVAEALLFLMFSAF